ncbi:FAD/NAD(P)-binding domain-containing protein [Roridomyces roridus]|uniref:FAD/NAD(P)-binding domain-containing protein n=1 Tax=Roridomyces roridus TaxID=1738132 RepID=A0AAD7B9F5_9AGAR|nr:FAD/NAD(P)-binding domain-containing protein [Roridomyces roridus]
MAWEVSDFMASPQPLQVAIVGAGIGGLSAALALRAQGHYIKIFEANRAETGVGISVQTNAMRVLQAYGVSRENLRGVPFDGFLVYNAKTGEDPIAWPWRTEAEVPGVRSLFCHRNDLHRELKRLAIGEGFGPPAQLYLDTRIVACDPDAGSITLATGETIHADLVVGADGINSVMRASVVGRPVQLRSQGLSCFRCLFDASALPRFPELAWLVQGPLHGARSVAWRGEGPAFRMLFIYPVRSGTLINIVAYFTDEEQDKPNWLPTATKQEVLKKFEGFHPKFLRLFDLPIVGPILKWQLKSVPLLPTWIRGRGALLGDSAHGTLPLLGQGAAIAIEEAGTLGALFPLGTPRSQVPARLAAYQAIRKGRGEFVNTESVSQAMDPQKRGSLARSPELQSLMHDYDTLAATREYCEAHFG